MDKALEVPARYARLVTASYFVCKVLLRHDDRVFLHPIPHWDSFNTPFHFQSNAPGLPSHFEDEFNSTQGQNNLEGRNTSR